MVAAVLRPSLSVILPLALTAFACSDAPEALNPITAQVELSIDTVPQILQSVILKTTPTRNYITLNAGGLLANADATDIQLVVRFDRDQLLTLETPATLEIQGTTIVLHQPPTGIEFATLGTRELVDNVHLEQDQVPSALELPNIQDFSGHITLHHVDDASLVGELHTHLSWDPARNGELVRYEIKAVFDLPIVSLP